MFRCVERKRKEWEILCPFKEDEFGRAKYLCKCPCNDDDVRFKGQKKYLYNFTFFMSFFNSFHEFAICKLFLSVLYVSNFFFQKGSGPNFYNFSVFLLENMK